MKQENKELLLKDLGARLPYGVMLNVKGQDGPKLFDFNEILYSIFLDGDYLSINDRGSGDVEGICEIKPYLRPIDSMTDEEWEEYNKSSGIEGIMVPLASEIDWLLAHHFDFRGLISRGLALEAPTGIYGV